MFARQGISQLHYARYALPRVLEDLKQEALVHILELPLVKDEVDVVRDALQLQFLAAYLAKGWSAHVGTRMWRK